MSEYSLADLTRITGAKRRTVQLWAEAGVIKADPGTERAGTGTHRRFSRAEAIIACLVHPFALRQMAIGELLRVAHAIRGHLKKNGIGKKVIDKAIEGKAYVSGYLAVTTWGDAINATIYGAADRTWADLWEAIGADATEHLNNPGSMSVVIRLDTYLAGLR